MAFGGADIKGLGQFDPTGDASVVSERYGSAGMRSLMRTQIASVCLSTEQSRRS